MKADIFFLFKSCFTSSVMNCFDGLIYGFCHKYLPLLFILVQKRSSFSTFYSISSSDKMAYFLALTAIASIAVPMLQSKHQHRIEIQLARELNEKRIFSQYRRCEERLKQLSCNFQEELTLNYQMHAHKMKVKTAVAKREAVRDAWQQHANLIQTILVVNTVVFACGFENFSQVTLPRETSELLLYFHSLCLGGVIIFSCLSIWSLIKLQSRLRGYQLENPNVVYACAKLHYNYNDYFDCHCDWLRQLSLFSLFTSAIFVLGAAAVVQAAKLQYRAWETFSTGMWVEVTLSTFFLLVHLIFLPVARIIWPSRTHTSTDDFGGICAEEHMQTQPL